MKSKLDNSTPIVHNKGMTTDELIRCAEHNANLINNRSQKVNRQ